MAKKTYVTLTSTMADKFVNAITAAGTAKAKKLLGADSKDEQVFVNTYAVNFMAMRLAKTLTDILALQEDIKDRLENGWKGKPLKTKSPEVLLMKYFLMNLGRIVSESQGITSKDAQ